MKKSSVRGKPILVVEILNISPSGFWILVEDVEYFAPFSEFPWFSQAKIGEIFEVEHPHPGHLYWPKLDIDLSVDSLTKPENFPLVAKVKKIKSKNK